MLNPQDTRSKIGISVMLPYIYGASDVEHIVTRELSAIGGRRVTRLTYELPCRVSSRPLCVLAWAVQSAVENMTRLTYELPRIVISQPLRVLAAQLSAAGMKERVGSDELRRKHWC